MLRKIKNGKNICIICTNGIFKYYKEEIMQKTVLNVPGISCGHCEKAIKGAVNGIPEVKKVKVDIKKKTVFLEYDNDKISIDKIKNAIEDAGYEIAD